MQRHTKRHNQDEIHEDTEEHASSAHYNRADCTLGDLQQLHAQRTNGYPHLLLRCY
jgi:hypothetical protein